MEVLEQIGLTRNEIKVYLALIDLGSSLAGKIAKKADLHRRPVYDALNRLIEKGLASYTIKSGKRYFQAANPEKLLETAKEREIKLKAIISELKERFQKIKVDVFSEIYEGKEGLKSVMEDILKQKKEWLTIGSTGKGTKILPFYLKNFTKRREKAKIKRKVLIARTKEGEEYYKELKSQKFVNVKFLPKNIKQPQTIWIYNDKVAIILVSLDHPVITLIQNKEIAESYREYFDWLWKIAKS